MPFKNEPNIESLLQKIGTLEAEVAELKTELAQCRKTPPKNALEVSGIHLEWTPEKGSCTFEGLPVAMMWIDSTLAGLLSGVQAMVGTERFALALQSEGRKSVDADWSVIEQFEQFEDGFRAIANIAAVAGWGRWELIELNRDAKSCTFRVHDSWEGLFQRTLGVYWGSNMVAGKLAGLTGKLFDENCWAEQTCFLARGDDYDEFKILPSSKSIEKEIENLLITDQATRADMAVALNRLQKEIDIRTQIEQQLREIKAKLETRVIERTKELADANGQLRRSEERFRSIVDSSPMGIHTYELNSEDHLVLQNTNPAASIITGENHAEMIGKGIETIVPGLSDTDIPGRLLEVCRTGQPWQSGQVEYTIKNTTTYFETYAFKTGDKTIAVMFLDVTQQVTAQKEREMMIAELNRSKKMEALGLLAGGVAHDLNNILSGLVGYPELLASMIPEDSPMQRPLNLIEASGIRASEVVHDLLTIARGAASERHTININDIVNEYLRSPEFETLKTNHPKAQVNTHLSPDIRHIKGSPVHIRKVIMNLVTNAAESIKSPGDVTIVTSNQYIDTPLSRYDSVKVGEYVLLSVQDTGQGISPKDLEHIFEPFYTKKRMGRSGTGLGLAVVWNCVKDHNGYIDISSTDKGTHLNIYFSATCEEAHTAEEGGNVESQGCGQKILVIDDEPNQRQVTEEILKHLGYDAYAAENGMAACDFVKEHRMDMVILDMIMPGNINGRETYKRLLQIQPTLPAIIVSGYARNNDVIQTQEMGAGAFVKKPFTVKQLSKAVYEELNRKRNI